MSYLRIEFHVRLVPRVRMRLYVVVWIVALKDVYGSQNVKSDLRHRCLNVNISRNHLAFSSSVNGLGLLSYFFEDFGKFVSPKSGPKSLCSLQSFFANKYNLKIQYREKNRLLTLANYEVMKAF